MSPIIPVLIVAAVLGVAATYRTPADPQSMDPRAIKKLRAAERVQVRLRALMKKKRKR